MNEADNIAAFYSPLPMLMKTLCRALLIPLLAGVACLARGADAATDEHPDRVTASAGSELTGQILFQFLVAEIAAGRGQLALSATQYLDLARRTQDVRIAKRAAEVALYGQQWPLALEATRLWSTLDGDSLQARHTLWVLLANSSQYDELIIQIRKGLLTAGASRGELMLQLPRVFAGVQDKTAAIRVLQEVTHDWPDLAEGHFVAAQVAVIARDDAAARQEIDAALRLNPDWQQAVLFKAQLPGQAPDAVITLLGDFADRHPDAREVRLALGRSLVDVKRYPEARTIFQSLLQAQPDTPELLYAVGLLSLQLGDGEAAEPPLTRLLALDFKDKEAIHFYLGQIAEQRNQLDAAVAHYDAIVLDSRRVPQARLRAAEILRRLGRVDESIAHLRAATVADPAEKESILVAESQMLTQAGRLEEAYGLIEKALAEQPDNPVLLYESAMLGSRLNRHEEAEAHLRHLVKLKPDDAHGWNALGYSLADRGAQLEDAQTYVDKALALAPNDAFILDSRGWVAYRRGDLSGAETWLRKAYGIRPDPEIAAHLGEVLWLQGRQDDARTLWFAARKADPDNEALNATIKRFAP